MPGISATSGRRGYTRQLSLESLENRQLLSGSTATEALEIRGSDAEPSLPDLVGDVFDAQEPLEWGQSFQVTAQVWNLGDRTAGASTAKFYLSANSTINRADVYLGSFRVPAIARGSHVSLDRQLRLPASPPSGFTRTDTVHIGMIVDADQEVAEMIELNNRNRGTGRDRDLVQIKPRPDLVGISFDADEPLEWGRDFNVSGVVKNQGSVLANASTVSFFLSSDSTITPSDIYLGSADVGAIRPRTCRTLHAALTLPDLVPTTFTPTANVYIGMILDSGNVVVERYESNNANRGTNIDRDQVFVTPGQTTANAFIVYEQWGGEFSDAEKSVPNLEDDLMCWAGAAANVLAWTGWGNAGGMTDADQMFRHFQDHWTDQGGSPKAAWDWWFTGVDTSSVGSHVDVPGGGGFYPWADFHNYFQQTYDQANIIPQLNDWLRAGYGTAMSIYREDRRFGHVITCWGVSHSPGDTSDIVGIWVTDSDDDKNDPNPPDRLRYYEVTPHDGRWYLEGYRDSDNWYATKLRALERMPNTGVYLLGDGHLELLGGAGQNQLFGDAGRDFLAGVPVVERVLDGTCDDILTRGCTAPDARDTALSSIVAEWGRNVASDERIDNLVRSVGLNGDGRRDDASVFNDRSRDSLWGSHDGDWFLPFGGIGG